jgi:hypothetical protein
VQRLPQIVDRARERGQVVDEVDRPRHVNVLDDVVVQELEVAAADVLEVRERRRLEVVDTDDAVALVEQVVAEMRA